MALTSGRRIGPYEIVDLLGAGGMGEVYRARDIKLKRDVAIKILPESFANDADRLARFQREAEVLATLNHPNIAAVYGLEDSGGMAAIVMELVEGEALDARLKPRVPSAETDTTGGVRRSSDGARGFSRAPGGLPIDEALAIARQVAEALEVAHDRGVIHRDLKPANIKVTPEGVVKVLDFGLAKMLDADASSRSSGPGLSMSPTLSLHATMQGVILGTAAYMSPEQARGKPVDRRTDIWAFGCVLFEMLTGRQVFEGGETVTDTVAAIIKNEPDWKALPDDTPPHIRSLLRRCLQKDLKRRLPHIGVARIEIEEGGTARQGSAGDADESRVAQSIAPARWALPWAVAGVAVAVAATLATIMLRQPKPDALSPVRFTIDPPEGATFGTNVALRGAGPAAPQFALSPDGRRLAYVMYAADGKARLWVRRLDALDGQPLPGTEEAAFPFWAPDSRVVAFFAQGKLKKIDTAGGPAQAICDAPAGEGGTWNRDGVIIFAPDQTTGLFRVPASGGVSTAVTTLDQSQGELSHRWPQFLPDDRHFLYLAMRGQVVSGAVLTVSESNRLTFVGSLDTPQRAQLLQGALRSAYAVGHLLFLREDTLVAQAFDVASLRLSGEPLALAEHVASNSGNGRTGFAVSDSGVLVYRDGAGGGAQTQLTWFDRAGKRLERVGQSAQYISVRLSPDDTRLSASVRENVGAGPASGDLWTFELARGAISSRLTLTPALPELGQAWSPDGGRIAYASGANGTAIYQKATTGVGDPELLVTSPLPKRAASWSPDGRSLVFTEIGSTTRTDIMVVPTTGDRTPVPLVRTEFDERAPTISPDGRWMAFDSDKGGRYAIYLRPFPAGDREWLISSDGMDPQWRGDGKELFYLSQRNLMAVAVRLGQTPEFGVPIKLFEAPINATLGQYSVASNGQRFLIVERPNSGRGAGAVPLTVLLNWTSGLKTN
jgi:eukaryotic-like serine/threonine-protein kinase